MSTRDDLPSLDWRYNQDVLPPWFTRPLVEPIGQGSLFSPGPEALGAVLASLHISVDDVARWHKRGWLSFGLALRDCIEAWHVDELRFVRDVVRSGLSDGQVETLLGELPRPLRLDPSRVAYSLSLGWVEAVVPSDPDPMEVIEENLDDWLAMLAADDPDRLEDHCYHVQRILKDLELDAREDIDEGESDGGSR